MIECKHPITKVRKAHKTDGGEQVYRCLECDHTFTKIKYRRT